MTKLNLFIGILVAAVGIAACNQDDMGDISMSKVNLMSFVASDDLPIVAAPDEEVTYNCTVSYSKGLASVEVSLDGVTIEGTTQTWEDAPTEVQYSFKYFIKGAQFGQTLDFVITATGVDGYKQSIDYPLWVTSNDVEFTILLPDGIPSDIYSNETVGFDILMSCGNVLKSFVITKNGEPFDSKDDFTTEKTFTYNFEYIPLAEDADKELEFHFVATDVKGNISESYYTLMVTKADVIGKELYSETFNTSLSISGTTEFDTAAGGVTGGLATQFVTSTIGNYNTLYVDNPDAPEGEPVLKKGAMEGCKVYDEDLSVIKYSSDGVDVCLSKYTDVNRQFVSGAHLWYRKNKYGWFRVDGIKLHGATSLKLSYSQSINKSKAKVEYSVDNGTTWVELIATDTQDDAHDKKFTVADGTETISLRFVENGGTVHVCLDNIKLVEIL